MRKNSSSWIYQLGNSCCWKAEHQRFHLIRHRLPLTGTCPRTSHFPIKVFWLHFQNGLALDSLYRWTALQGLARKAPQDHLEDYHRHCEALWKWGLWLRHFRRRENPALGDRLRRICPSQHCHQVLPDWRWSRSEARQINSVISISLIFNFLVGCAPSKLDKRKKDLRRI